MERDEKLISEVESTVIKNLALKFRLPVNEIHSILDEVTSLTISGVKKNETEDKKGNYHYLERSYGSFKRVIPLGDNIDKTKITANFKKGVLKINIPKNTEYISKQKKIPIQTE